MISIRRNVLYDYPLRACASRIGLGVSSLQGFSVPYVAVDLERIGQCDVLADCQNLSNCRAEGRAEGPKINLYSQGKNLVRQRLDNRVVQSSQLSVTVTFTKNRRFETPL